MAGISNKTTDISRLNFEESIRQIPLSTFLGILAVVGLTGNTLVLYIYAKVYTVSSSRIFIMCLAMVDLSTCALALPVEIVTVLNQYQFDSPNLCKFSRFVNSLTTVASSAILVFIAIDRYRKICHPIGWQISSGKSKILCGVALAISVFFNWPVLILYGTKSVPLPQYNITGTECSVDDAFVPYVYPLLYNLASVGVFMVAVLVLVILYSLIGKKVRFFAKKKEFREPSSDSVEEITSSKQKQRRQKLESVNKELSSRFSFDGSVSACQGNEKEFDFSKKVNQDKNGQRNQSLGNNNQMSQSLETIISTKTDTDLDQIVNNRSKINAKDVETPGSTQNRQTSALFGLTRIASLKIRVSRIRKNKLNRKRKFDPSRKKLAKSTTYLMLVITMAFIFSFVPYLLLALVREVNKQFVNDLTNEGRAAYRFFLRSYFINCAVNPVLYSIFDMRFRKALKSLILKLRTMSSCSGGTKV